MRSPSVPLGWTSHTVQPQGTLPSPKAQRPLLQAPGRAGGPAPLLTTPLPADSQRHRLTEEEIRQNRFQMPLEEGPMPPLEEGESGWAGAWGQ